MRTIELLAIYLISMIRLSDAYLAHADLVVSFVSAVDTIRQAAVPKDVESTLAIGLLDYLSNKFFPIFYTILALSGVSEAVAGAVGAYASRSTVSLHM